MIRYATLEQARMVVPSWNGEASSVRHLGNSASSVFVYRQGQVSRILKLTDASFRTALEGYCETETLPRYYEEQLAVFLRLRAVYVYLDRLYSFGPTPNAEQHKTLEKLKARVHSMAGKP